MSGTKKHSAVSTGVGHLASYGTGGSETHPTAGGHVDRHKRMNVVAIILAFLLPLMIFTFNFYLVSFHTHYAHPGLCWFFVCCAFLVAMICATFALQTIRLRKAGDIKFDEPSWLIFICISTFIAWGAGIALGLWNYWGVMLPYYRVQTLSTYTDLNPANQLGGAVMDAGLITFSPDSYILTQFAIGFKKDDIYCAAPVTSIPLDQGGHLAIYDFWVVGTNCCSGEPGDFHCGEQDGKLSLNGGTRIVRNEVVPWFSLAAQQAEAYYHIKVGHPIFVRNDADPLRYHGNQNDKGVKFFCLCVMLAFGLQGFLVLFIAVAFAKAYNHSL